MYAPSCVLSKHLIISVITDKIEVPSIFPNSEMASSIRRSFSKVKLFFQACSDLGLGGKEGEFVASELICGCLTLITTITSSYIVKEHNNELKIKVSFVFS